MCRRVSCGTCGRPTFAGCGQHIERVLGDVPASERCRCAEERSQPEQGGGGPRQWFRNLLRS